MRWLTSSGLAIIVSWPEKNWVRIWPFICFQFYGCSSRCWKSSTCKHWFGTRICVQFLVLVWVHIYVELQITCINVEDITSKTPFSLLTSSSSGICWLVTTGITTKLSGINTFDTRTASGTRLIYWSISVHKGRNFAISLLGTECTRLVDIRVTLTAFRVGKDCTFFYTLYVLDNLCPKTKVSSKSLMDDLLSLSVQVHQTVNNCDCTAVEDPLKKFVTSFWLKWWNWLFVNRVMTPPT